jgi:hypothetical protein
MTGMSDFEYLLCPRGDFVTGRPRRFIEIDYA